MRHNRIMMDYSSNRKYFVQKNPAPFHILFVLMIFATVILIFTGPRRYPLAFSLLGISAVMEVIVLQRHVTEKYFENGIPEAREAFQTEFKQTFFPHEDDRTVHENAIASAALSEKHGEPVFGGEYLFMEEPYTESGIERFLRRGADGRARSSIYCLTGLQIDPHRIYLMKKYISMIDDTVLTKSFSARYQDLSVAEIERTPLSVGIPSARCVEIVLKNTAGEVCFRLPVSDNCDDEEHVKQINKAILGAEHRDAVH